MSLTPSFFSGGGRRDAEQVVLDDLIATENLNLGHIVRTVIGDSSGVLAKAENTTNNVIGISNFDVSSGSIVEVVQSGVAVVKFDSQPVSGDIGKRVYVGASGLATLTPVQESGKYLIQLGYLLQGGTDLPKVVLRIHTLHKFS
tara:strand:+ start:10320 stop:10751 length:432 start_codon:yes stop_codon:yes gene_type:complete